MLESPRPLGAHGALFLLATMSGACGSAALEAQKAAPAHDEPNAAWYFEQGSAAAAQGDPARAEQYLSIALEHGDDQRHVLPVLLSVCLRSGHLREALNHAEPYLRDHPNELGLRYLVASIYAGLGATERAENELERILRDDPAYARAHYLLAMLELDTGASGAEAHLQRYLECEPHGDHAADVESRLRELAQ